MPRAVNHLEKNHLFFAAGCAAIALICFPVLTRLYAFSLRHEFASMIPIIPFMSAVLVWRKRNGIFENARASFSLPASGLVATGMAILIWTVNAGSGSGDADLLSFQAAGLVCFLLGAFLFAYGWPSFKRALFPLLMLLFLILIPGAGLAMATRALQKGSAEGAAFFFKLTGTPFHRQFRLTKADCWVTSATTVNI